MHRDMEIVTWVLSGALEHRDSLGSGSVIRPGEVQRMSAGRGVAHSEFNASETDPVHFLQIWILPESRDLAASYEQKRIPADEMRRRLRRLRRLAARGIAATDLATAEAEPSDTAAAALKGPPAEQDAHRHADDDEEHDHECEQERHDDGPSR